MPRRVDSDEDDFKPRKKKTTTIQKAKKPTTKPSSSSSKAKSAANGSGGESVISAWAKRRTVESLDGIEDVESVSPQRPRVKPKFEVDDGIISLVEEERLIVALPAVAQLGVHKKKVGEVSTWLKDFPHHRKKLLVLSGPAGAGKSTTVQSLAKSHGVQIIEWINPVDELKLASQTDEIQSLSRKFSTFLQNSQRYTSLESAAHQIVLIQDLPNTIGSSTFMAQARHLFQTSLREFLTSSRVRYPVVLIVTESEVGSGEDFGYSSTYRGEGLTVKGLLGDEILNHPATTHITFNPIAKTIMLKAIQAIPALKVIPKPLLESIIDISAGDIRSAINCSTLVALQLHHSPRRKPDISILAGLECREGGLDLFHAAGRVVYNKRFGDEPEDLVVEVPALPPHLTEWTRRASKVDIDDLLTSVQTDTSTLRALIHQNFPLSCFSIDELDDVYTTLSDSDFLFPTLSTASPVQDQLAAYYTVGKVLLCLPSPVAKRSDFAAMRWPESNRLPKKIRDARDKFHGVLNVLDVSTSKREDMLLDVLPLSWKIEKKMDGRMRRNLRQLCQFPLKGKMLVEEHEVEEEVTVVKGVTKGWLSDDDIED